MPDAALADSGLTAGWLVDTLLQCNPEFKTALGGGKVVEIDMKDISEGLASRVYKVVMKLIEANAEEYAVIIKVPTMAKLEQLQEDLAKEMNDAAMEGVKEVLGNIDNMALHNIECAFYEAVCDVDDVPLPKVWYTRKNSEEAMGVILMKDLSAVGCMMGFTQFLTAQQLRNITRHFAALHAYQLCANGEQQKRIAAVPFRPKILTEGNLLLPLVAGVPETNEGGVLSGLARKMRLTGSSEFGEFVMFDRPKELGIPPLLCQGDSGRHNLFFKRADDGTVSNGVCAIFDWQFAFRGNPFYDIARFAVSNADAEVRREVEVDLVEHYYEHLKKAVEKRGGKKLDFGLERLREAYELSKAQSAWMNLGWIPLISVIAKDKVSASVLDALREKALVRGKLALADGIEALKKYAPQFLVE